VPIKNPPHTGGFIRTEIIAPAGSTVTADAAALQVSAPPFPACSTASPALSGEMALRI